MTASFQPEKLAAATPRQSPASATDTVTSGSNTLAWFHDPASRGSWNMALDEALLQRAMSGGQPTLRFYAWDQPTLSLGYFQRYADRVLHPASLQCAVVRRATGGGAILHDQELTYSCVLPAGHSLSRRAADLYYAIHQSIVALLAQCGLAAHLYRCDDKHPPAASPDSRLDTGCGASELAAAAKASHAAAEPFLCFQRRTAGDVLLEDHKIAGSAQRRCRGAVVQHGSILLSRSQYAPELPGIRDLGLDRLDAFDLAERMRTVLSDRLKLDVSLEVPSSELLDRAAHIEASKFADQGWQRLR